MKREFRRASVSEEVKFQELMSTIRHYSTLRFAILTVFVAISGGIFTAFFDCLFAQSNEGFIGFFQAGGLILSIAFLVLELALDRNLTDLWQSVTAIVGRGDALVAHRALWKSVLVPVTTYGIYIVSILFWYFLAPEYYPCNLRG